MSIAEFHELTIESVRPQSDFAVSLAFAVPEHLAEQYRFTPGQYLTLRATIDGEDVRRSYSICSAVQQEGVLEVGIKAVPGGAFSNYAMQLGAGDTLQVMTPQGRFVAEPGGTHLYLLLAVGSGITPCLSIARSVLAAEPDSRVTLVYGNRNSTAMMFRDEIHALKDRHIERFRLVNIMSGEQQEAELLNGRIDAEKINQLTQHQLLQPHVYDGCYICGPQQMMEQTSAALEALGVEKSRIHIELFVTDSTRVPAPRPAVQPAVDDGDGIEVTVVLDGVQRQIVVNPAADTVLSAAQRAGLDLPFSCAGGMCCTCRCKVKSGTTSMDTNYSLAEWEIEAGYTLACQTRPVDSPVTLDFDAT
jgi:ring-1,2-phenylacetyl-CoA epoxidase subunit PaaE